MKIPIRVMPMRNDWRARNFLSRFRHFLLTPFPPLGHFSTLNRVESSRARLREAEVTLEESPEGDRDAARQHVESARVEHEDKKTEEGALLNESSE